MIRELIESDISAVARIHHQEMIGFLPELGIDFLEKFYRISLYLKNITTFVAFENDQVLGFVCLATRTKGLFFHIIKRDLFGFSFLFLKYFITHPGKIKKLVKVLTYPGFSQGGPELLSIAVQKKQQKKGIGRSLFKKTCQFFKKKGIKKFKVSVYDRLAANIFYRKMGATFYSSFDFLGEKMNYYIYSK